MRRFTDRKEAGHELAAMLHVFGQNPDVVVLGLPRGGVCVAAEVAELLDVPFDVLPVQRLALAGSEEYAIGAVGADGLRTIDWRTADALRLSDTAIDALIARKCQELDRRIQLYRSVKDAVDITGHTVVIIDDGLVSGTTMTTAIAAARKLQPARIVVAAPVGSREAQDVVQRLADATVFAYTPARLYGLSLWYEDFTTVSDTDVVRLLRRDATRRVTPVRVAAHT